MGGMGAAARVALGDLPAAVAGELAGLVGADGLLDGDELVALLAAARDGAAEHGVDMARLKVAVNDRLCEGRAPAAPLGPGDMRIKSLPEGARRALGPLDRDGNGVLAVHEIELMAALYREQKERARLANKLLMAGAVLLFLFTALLLGVLFAAVELSKDTEVQGSVVMVKGTSDPIKMAQTDFTVTAPKSGAPTKTFSHAADKPGIFTDRKGDPISMLAAKSDRELELASIPDEDLAKLNTIRLQDDFGCYMNIKVAGFDRHVFTEAINQLWKLDVLIVQTKSLRRPFVVATAVYNAREYCSCELQGSFCYDATLPTAPGMWPGYDEGLPDPYCEAEWEDRAFDTDFKYATSYEEVVQILQVYQNDTALPDKYFYSDVAAAYDAAVGGRRLHGRGGARHAARRHLSFLGKRDCKKARRQQRRLNFLGKKKNKCRRRRHLAALGEMAGDVVYGRDPELDDSSGRHRHRHLSFLGNKKQKSSSDDDDDDDDDDDECEEEELPECEPRVNHFKNAAAGFTKAVEGTVKAVSDVVADVVEDVVDIVEDVAEAVGEFVEEAVDEFGEWIEDRLDSVKEWINDRKEDLVDFIQENLLSLPGQVGDAIVETLGNNLPSTCFLACQDARRRQRALLGEEMPSEELHNALRVPGLVALTPDLADYLAVWRNIVTSALAGVDGLDPAARAHVDMDTYRMRSFLKCFEARDGDVGGAAEGANKSAVSLTDAGCAGELTLLIQAVRWERLLGELSPDPVLADRSSLRLATDCSAVSWPDAFGHRQTGVGEEPLTRVEWLCVAPGDVGSNGTCTRYRRSRVLSPKLNEGAAKSAYSRPAGARGARCDKVSSTGPAIARRINALLPAELRRLNAQPVTLSRRAPSEQLLREVVHVYGNGDCAPNGRAAPTFDARSPACDFAAAEEAAQAGARVRVHASTGEYAASFGGFNATRDATLAAMAKYSTVWRLATMRRRLSAYVAPEDMLDEVWNNIDTIRDVVEWSIMALDFELRLPTCVYVSEIDIDISEMQYHIKEFFASSMIGKLIANIMESFSKAFGNRKLMAGEPLLPPDLTVRELMEACPEVTAELMDQVMAALEQHIDSRRRLMGMKMGDMVKVKALKIKLETKPTLDIHLPDMGNASNSQHFEMNLLDKAAENNIPFGFQFEWKVPIPIAPMITIQGSIDAGVDRLDSEGFFKVEAPDSVRVQLHQAAAEVDVIAQTITIPQPYIEVQEFDLNVQAALVATAAASITGELGLCVLGQCLQFGFNSGIEIQLGADFQAQVAKQIPEFERFYDGGLAYRQAGLLIDSCTGAFVDVWKGSLFLQAGVWFKMSVHASFSVGLDLNNPLKNLPNFGALADKIKEGMCMDEERLDELGDASGIGGAIGNVKDKVEEFMEKASYQERFSMRRELFNKDASLCIMAGPMVAWRVNLTDSLYTSYGRRGDGTFGVIDLAEQEMIDAASDEEVLLPPEPPSPPYVAVTAPPPPSTL